MGKEVKTHQDIASGNPLLVGRCYEIKTFIVYTNVWLNYKLVILCVPGIAYGCVCCRVVNFKSKEFSLSYLELSENCTTAELTNNLEPIDYKYNNLLAKHIPVQVFMESCIHCTNIVS